jgi:hypothetical protein
MDDVDEFLSRPNGERALQPIILFRSHQYARPLLESDKPAFLCPFAKDIRIKGNVAFSCRFQYQQLRFDPRQ